MFSKFKCLILPYYSAFTADQCKTIINDAGMEATEYPMAVAHGIHSLNLESVRHFFKSDATENNKIPTASSNLSAENPILDNVSLAGYDTSLRRYFRINILYEYQKYTIISTPRAKKSNISTL